MTTQDTIHTRIRNPAEYSLKPVKLPDNRIIEERAAISTLKNVSSVIELARSLASMSGGYDEDMSSKVAEGLSWVLIGADEALQYAINLLDDDYQEPPTT
ncbi:MAG: hypothetical protein H7833_04425 [Magnetococcus sp. DMHC-1]